jgi:hypothetical protein
MVDGHHGTIRFENNLISGPLSPTPVQASGFEHLILRHNTIDVKFTTPQDASVGFVVKYVGAARLLTCVNNILSGFYMRDEPLETYFDDASVIENNIVTSQPGWVTPYGTNLPGLPEYGTSARLNSIPNQVVTAAEQTSGTITGTIARTWELANTPTLSPGIGQGQATDIASDLLGRAHTSPPDVGCLQSSSGVAVTPVPRPPYVLSRTPAPGATGVPATPSMSITLYPLPGQTIDAATVTSGVFTLTDPSGQTIPSTVNVNSATGVISLTVQGFLYPLVIYTLTLTTAVADTQGNHLASTQTWTFRVAGPSSPAVYGGTMTFNGNEVFANDSAAGTLGASINASVTTITLTAGHGARFPAVGTGKRLRLRCDDEIMVCTGHVANSNSFTVVRGQEGTAAASHAANADVFAVLTAGAVNDHSNDLATANSGILAEQVGTGWPTRPATDSPVIWIGWTDPTALMHDYDLYVAVPAP